MPTTSGNTALRTASRAVSPRRVRDDLDVPPATPGPEGDLRPAVDYLRVSKGKMGRSRSTKEQQKENRENAKLLRCQIRKSYEDFDRPASVYSTRKREAFEQLRLDIESGRLDGYLLIIWEVSRGSRKMWEWAQLIQLMIEHGMSVYETSQNYEYDLTNYRDVQRLHEEAAAAQAESGRTQMRISRNTTAGVEEGRPHSQTCYGYERIYNTRSGALLEQRPHPVHAEVVRRIFKLFLSGESVRSIVNTLNGEEVPSPGGALWSSATITRLLRRETYIGVRTHQKGRTGPVERVDGIWEGLVDEADFWSVQRVLSDPARAIGKPGKLKYWLSGALLCGVCGHDMRRWMNKNAPSGPRELYRCHSIVKPCTSITRETTEAVVAALLLRRLSDPAVRDRLLSGGHDDEDMVAARAEVNRLKAEQAELDDLRRLPVGHPDRLKPVNFSRMWNEYDDLIADAEEKVREAAVDPQLRRLLGNSSDGMTARWAATTIPAKRDIVRKVMEVRVNRRVAGASQVIDRLEIAWVGACQDVA